MWGVDLCDADLCDADVWGADLRGARGIIDLGRMGSRGAFLYVVAHDTGPMFKTGCFWGNEAAFLTAIDETHGNNAHGVEYRAAIDAALRWFEAERTTGRA